MMLAPRRLDSPNGSYAGDFPALRLAACAASSRADTTCGRFGEEGPLDAFAAVDFLADAFPKIAIRTGMPLE
ncbi:MAG: hypothetical protein KGL70_07095 [Betaproteobacteria bacterium]|nr:hypothetical protein [Betaproteobacteria bacterium]